MTAYRTIIAKEPNGQSLTSYVEVFDTPVRPINVKSSNGIFCRRVMQQKSELKMFKRITLAIHEYGATLFMIIFR